MSSFQVSTSCVDAIVGVVLHLGSDQLLPTFDSYADDNVKRYAGTKLGQALQDLNVAAVNYRYSSNDESPRYLYTKKVYNSNVKSFRGTGDSRTAALVRCLKAIRCWSYQCSEGEFESILFVQMKEFLAGLAGTIVSSLPAYESAPWGE